MEAKKDVFEKGRSVRDMHHLRLMSLLQELERDHGRKKAAELLGVDRRTLDASLDEGVLTRRIRNALQKALQSGLGSAAAEQRDRNDKLADELADIRDAFEELAKETRVSLRGHEDANRAVREEWAQAQRKLEKTLAELRTRDGSEGEAQAAGDGPKQGRRSTLRREYPDLVTLDPAPDDEKMFGEAWPLIVEWRALKDTHPNKGKGLAWLTVEVQFLALELTLLEEHGLTLPPARFPLHGLDRNGQITWRRTALSDTRRALRKREFLNRWTLGRLWK